MRLSNEEKLTSDWRILCVAAKLLSNQNVTSMCFPIVEEFSAEILSMLIFSLPVYTDQVSKKSTKKITSSVERNLQQHVAFQFPWRRRDVASSPSRVARCRRQFGRRIFSLGIRRRIQPIWLNIELETDRNKMLASVFFTVVTNIVLAKLAQTF